MTQETQAAIEALRQAMRNEEETRDFYLDAVQKVVDEKARQMFEELAQEEIVHMKIVGDQYEALKAGGNWTAVADFAHMGDVDITPLAFRRGDMDKRITDRTTDLEALTIAAEMENNSFNFYVEQYDRTTDPLGKQIYGGLLKAERNHFNTVMSNWEYLVNMGR